MVILQQITFLALSFSLTTNALAQTVEQPTYRIGDTWIWSVKDKSRDICSPNAKPEDKETQTILEVIENGYIAEFTLAAQGLTYKRRLAKNLSTSSNRDGKLIISDTHNFPMKTGNTWETTLSSGSIVTALKCQQEEQEKMKVGSEEFQVTPVSCKGKWTNVTSNNSDQAIYKYWYSPEIGNFVRRTVFTYFQGQSCSVSDRQLESFKRAS